MLEANIGHTFGADNVISFGLTQVAPACKLHVNMLADYSLIIARRKMRSSIMVDDPVRMVAGRVAVGDTMIGYQSSAAIPGCRGVRAWKRWGLGSLTAGLQHMRGAAHSILAVVVVFG